MRELFKIWFVLRLWIPNFWWHKMNLLSFFWVIRNMKFQLNTPLSVPKVRFSEITLKMVRRWRQLLKNSPESHRVYWSYNMQASENQNWLIKKEKKDGGLQSLLRFMTNVYDIWHTTWLQWRSFVNFDFVRFGGSYLAMGWRWPIKICTRRIS